MSAANRNRIPAQRIALSSVLIPQARRIPATSIRALRGHNLLDDVTSENDLLGRWGRLIDGRMRGDPRRHLHQAVFAVALSPFTPIGIARTAEPHPGFNFDSFSIALGGASASVFRTDCES